MPENTLIESLIQTLTELTHHLEKENAILRERDAAALEPLMAEKNRLSDAYIKIMHVLRRNPGIASEISEDVKTRLRQTGTNFNAVMEEHNRRVTALKGVSEGIIKAITTHVDSKNRLSGVYGEAALPARSAPSSPTTIAFDRQI